MKDSVFPHQNLNPGSLEDSFYHYTFFFHVSENEQWIHYDTFSCFGAGGMGGRVHWEGIWTNDFSISVS